MNSHDLRTRATDWARDIIGDLPFTDDPELAEESGELYLVEDRTEVIHALADDYEEGEFWEFGDPEDFLKKHGIKTLN